MSKRTEYEYTIPASVMCDNIERKVTAQRTATPGLIVHVKLGHNGESSNVYPRLWAITHESTGLGADSSYGMGLRKARLLAGAMGGLPVDWTATHDEVMRQWNAVDPKLREWMKAAGRS